jgi:hypothetical protein
MGRRAGYAEAVPCRLLIVGTASILAAISRLDWLTNAEDDARTDAAERGAGDTTARHVPRAGMNRT